MKTNTSKACILSVILFLFFLNFASAVVSESITFLELKIPEYQVTTIDNLDYVGIPGGEILIQEEGRPEVPYFIKTIDYPRGCRVQNVILRERSNLTTTTNLKLPVVILSPYPELPIEMKKGWYPEEEYDWKVWENPDGSTTLVIALYAFYYNPETTDVKFYRNYKFDIKHIISTVDITDLTLDKDTYQPGDSIVIDLLVNSFGEAQDVVVNFDLRRYGSDEMIDGLPLRSLKKLIGEASLTARWNSDNAEPGFYYVEASLTDSAGNLLDKNTLGFEIQLAETPEKPTETSTVYFIIVGVAITVIAIIALLIMKKRSKHKK